jgi:hypothetical protein
VVFNEPEKGCSSNEVVLFRECSKNAVGLNENLGNKT